MLTHPNCKINMGLRVVRRRPDGYHDLETVFVPIPLCDELEISPADHFSFRMEGLTFDGDTESNVVVRAYRLMQHEYGNRVGNVAICLKKNIPTGAGLGGGSSDAAFALKMVNQIFGLGLHSDTLRQHAASIGADCAFFIDNVPAYATGIGDLLTPIGCNPIDGLHLLLVKPDVAVSTADAYRGIVPRQLKEATMTDAMPLPKAITAPRNLWPEQLVNDFEDTVFAKHPIIKQLKDLMYTMSADYAAMSGSGAAVYGLFNEQETLDLAVGQLRDDYPGLFIYATSVPAKSPHPQQ